MGAKLRKVKKIQILSFKNPLILLSKVNHKTIMKKNLTKKSILLIIYTLNTFHDDGIAVSVEERVLLAVFSKVVVAEEEIVDFWRLCERTSVQRSIVCWLLEQVMSANWFGED